MENSLLNYMNRRFGEVAGQSRHSRQSPGPVITISREAGCGGLKIARKLSKTLNEFATFKKWQVISKEVLQKSAEELKLAPQKVNRIFTPNERFTFDELLEAFNAKSYKSDRVILKAVREVIREFAIDGHCIIVGRAGHIIAGDIERSLHIRLEAPLNWRIEKIAAKQKIAKEEARAYIHETEKKRETFRKYYLDKKNPDEHFDLGINVSRFRADQIIQLIKTSVELKGIAEKYRSGVFF